tara:strand:+ start:158 stop:823 length:666 start_codon:yes stop_codon:yes gene_type:complete
MPRPNTKRDLQRAAELHAPKAFAPWEILHEPVKEGASWVVRAEDKVLGVMETKKFRSQALALDFYASVLLGKAPKTKEEKIDARIDSLSTPVGKSTRSTAARATDLAQSGKAQFDPRGRNSGKPNLEDVHTVLASYGLDTIVELAGILVPHDIIGDDGEVEGQGYQLDPKERAKTLLELTQYIRPKLKAVEVTTKGDELTEKQVDDRLRSLLDKALRRDAE